MDEWQDVSSTEVLNPQQAAPPQPVDDWEDVTPQASQSVEADDWEDVTSPLSSQAASQPPPAVDPLTGENMLPGVDGTSPQSAINQSPLTPMERFNLSMGNAEGNVQYLKKSFGEQNVATIFDSKGKPTKELAVKSGEHWYRVDPENGDIRDPWELAKSYVNNPKEFVGDIADLGPLGVFAGVAATPAVSGLGLATATGAAVAGAATAGITTSLGRIAGTYEATPGEQIWDMAFEGMVNAAGAKIAAGVKPTADWVAKNVIKPASEMAKTIGGGSLRQLLGRFSVGTDAWDTMAQHPKRLSEYMSTVFGKAGKNSSAYHDEITSQQVDTVRAIASKSGEVTGKIYSKMRNEVLNNVERNFKANLDEPIMGAYQDAIKSKLGYIEAYFPEIQNTVKLQGNDALDFLAKAETLQGFKFKLYPMKALRRRIKSGVELSGESGMIDLPYLATDAEAHNLVKTYFEKLSIFAGRPQMSGKAAARDLLDFKKVAGDISWAMSNSEKAEAIPGVKKILDQTRVNIDNTVRNSLDDTAKIAFDKMNTTFNKLKKELSPVESAWEQYKKSGNRKVFESLLNRFTSRPGKNATEKFALDAMIDASETHGLKDVAQELSSQKTDLLIAEAAKRFNPIVDGTIKRAMVAGSAPFVVGIAAATKNPAWLIPWAVSKGVSSPGVAQTTVQSMAKGNQWLQSLSKSQLAEFMSSPEGATAFTNAILNAPMTRAKADQMLQQQIQSVMQEQ